MIHDNTSESDNYEVKKVIVCFIERCDVQLPLYMNEWIH